MVIRAQFAAANLRAASPRRSIQNNLMSLVCALCDLCIHKIVLHDLTLLVSPATDNESQTPNKRNGNYNDHYVVTLIVMLIRIGIIKQSRLS
jgi:hypothetical protein